LIVPSLIGDPLPVASDKVGLEGLVMSPTNTPSGSGAIVVVGQSPPAGTRVAKGSTIKITLS
jgi:beta-lactam-binding protein with PASTA domain